MPTNVHLALGSNVGDRRTHLDTAVRLLREAGVSADKVSTYHETEPVGGPPDQGRVPQRRPRRHDALNPAALLAKMQDVERRFGPGALGQGWAANHRSRSALLWRHGHPSADSGVAPARAASASAGPPVRAGAAGGDRRGGGASRLSADRGRAADRRAATIGSPGQQTAGRELAGWRALVTGSTSGIGRAIALELAAAGPTCWCMAGARRPRARKSLPSCQGQGGRSATLLADLGDEAACRDLAHRAWRLWNGLDIVIANAGADTLTGEAARWPFERKLAELWAVDVRGDDRC